jgi:hypothetical protein
MDLREAMELWDPEPGWLNTASYGLPPEPAWRALQAALADWRHGRTSWEGWDASTGRARTAFARLVAAPVDDIAVGAQVSQLLAPVSTYLLAARTSGWPHRGDARFAISPRCCGTGSVRCTQAGTPARTCTTRTMGCRCDLRHRHADSISRQRGSRMWAQPPRWTCWPRWASKRSTTTT